MVRKCIIGGKKYTVDYRFNMVGNFYFTREGEEFLVDAEDVWGWVQETRRTFKNGIEAAIAFAKEMASLSNTGIFWWKIKEIA